MVKERPSHCGRSRGLLEKVGRGLRCRLGEAFGREKPGKGHGSADRIPEVVLRGVRRGGRQAGRALRRFRQGSLQAVRKRLHESFGNEVRPALLASGLQVLAKRASIALAILAKLSSILPTRKAMCSSA